MVNKDFIKITIIRLIIVILMIGMLYFLIANGDDKKESSTGYFFLSDNYDTSKTTFYDFLTSEDSYEILKSTYSQILNNKGIPFLEVADQSIEYMGTSEFSEDFSDSGTIDQINQTDTFGNVFSSLKSMQISRNAADAFGIHIPDNIEWVGMGTINVLLGDSYRKYFQVGDHIDFRYLGEKRFSGVICGFLEEGENIMIDNEVYYLDHFVIIPSIELEQDDSMEYKKILLSVKCEGVLYFANSEEKQKTLLELKNLADKTGYKYSLRGEYNELFD